MDADGLKTSGFTVLAYYTGVTKWANYTAPANPDFMNDQTVTWNGTSGAWEYTPPKYWPRKDNDNTDGDDWGNVTFFAFSTATDAIASADGVASSNPKITFTTPETAAEQVDLVAAVVTDASGGTNNGKVKFDFKHILSKIGFAAKLAEDDGDATEVKVKSLKVNTGGKVGKSGTYTFKSDNTIADWSLTTSSFLGGNGDELYSNSSGLTLTTTPQDLCNLANPKSYLMLIPQELNAGDMSVDLEFDVITTAGGTGGGTSTSTSTIKADLPVISGGWKAGKAYTYNLVVTLTGVEFDTPTVAGWDAGTQPGDTGI
jgi:hypothetical protein